MSHLLKGLGGASIGTSSLADSVAAYEAEMIPRGAEEVKCCVENGLMLHDWEKVKQSPVFKVGFKPMAGHNPSSETPVQAKEVTGEA